MSFLLQGASVAGAAGRSMAVSEMHKLETGAGEPAHEAAKVRRGLGTASRK